MASITYIAGLLIRAHSPKTVAQWYGEVLGLPRFEAQGGGYFSVLETALGPIHFGVIERDRDGMGFAASRIAFTLRVDDFDAFVKELADQGLEPESEIEADYGRFAYYRDIEGNQFAIWSE